MHKNNICVPIALILIWFIFEGTALAGSDITIFPCLRKPMMGNVELDRGMVAMASLSSAPTLRLVGWKQFTEALPIYQEFCKLNGNKPVGMYKVKAVIEDDSMAHKPQELLIQFGEDFDRLDHDEYIAVSMEVQFNNYTSYSLFIDRKSKIMERFNRLDFFHLTLESYEFLYVFDKYADYIGFRLMALNAPELRGKRLISKSFPYIIAGISRDFGRIKIKMDVMDPGIAKWAGQYFAGEVKRISIEDSSGNEDVSSINWTWLSEKLSLIGVFSNEEWNSIITKSKNEEGFIAALQDFLSKQIGERFPWPYFLSLIIEKQKKHNFIGTIKLNIEGVIPGVDSGILKGFDSKPRCNL